MTAALLHKEPHFLPSGPVGSVDAYIQAVAGIPVLSQDEERSLAVRFRQDGDLEAARQLVVSHLRFVIHIARSYTGYGLQLGDLFPSSPGPELIATTLNGDLFVFAIDGDGITQLLFRTRVEGALGAFNSIVVANLDQVPGNELYVAGSLGLRKFVHLP